MRAICFYVTVWVVCFVIWGCHEGNLPLARFTSTEIPNTGIVNRSAFIEVMADNEGEDASAGSIIVSFPEGPQVSVLDVDTTRVMVYPAGSQVRLAGAKKTFVSTHPLAEARQEPWKAGEVHRLRLRIIPSRAGTLRVLVRAALNTPGGKVIATPKAGPPDQAGFPAQEYKINVINENKSHYHSLGDLLDANGVDLRNMETSDLNQIMIGSVILDDSEMLCIVGDGESGNLYIYLRRKGEDRWNYKVLEKTAGGPITGISRSKNYIYLVFHLTPSANETVILSNELEFQYEFMGWPLAIFDDETIVYHNMMVHFSPFHHAEISIYNPHTGQDRKIFPMEPYQEFRLEHIKRVKAFYDKHNIDLDPESFNANLMGDVAINDDTSALAFVIAYESQYTNYYPDREGEIEPDPEYATEYTEVAYIYRDIKDAEEITYKEVLLSDLKRRYGDIPISEYPQTDRLNEIFTE